jgi:hypothetical protein
VEEELLAPRESFEKGREKRWFTLKEKNFDSYIIFPGEYITKTTPRNNDEL